MTPLPLVLEPTARFLLLALPLGGSLIGMVGYMLWRVRRDWSAVEPRQWLTFVVMGGLGTMLFLQPVGWQLRFDQQGIALRAPFDLFADRGAIPWNDLKDIRFGMSSGRSSSPILKFVDGSGTVLTLQCLDGVPDGFWPAMAAVVEAKATNFRFKKDKEDWLASARGNAQPSPGQIFGWTYTAHDGEGRAL
ncbi:MAG TPA: hypothetical protein VMI56_25775 [Reyranella sp.]|nr:hypothetical protein [Reyranella sp.]